MHKRTIAGTLLAASALAVGMLAAGPAAQATPTTKAIPNSAPTWLARAQKLGSAALGDAVSARVYLSPNGGLAALQREAYAVSTPGSASFRHFLTPAQYFATYGTPGSSVAGVSSWLTGAGMSVTSVEAHNRWVDVTGSVAAAQRAFGATISRYDHDGMTVQAPDGALSVPSALASAVLTVAGVDTTPLYNQPSTQNPAPPSAGFRNATPCSAYYGEKLATALPQFNGQTLPYAPCGYVGSQLRSAYEGATTLNGSGVTVAITDAYASPTIATDAATYASRHGDAGYADGQLTQNLPTAFNRGGTVKKGCGASGWYGEQTLDVEAVHAMAPAANIRYYASASCYDADFLAAFARINDEAAVQLVSNSWGGVETATKSTLIAAYEQAFLQGASEGISYLFSSGDNGDQLANTGTRQDDYPAADPFVTAVGGTSTAIGATGHLDWATGWGTSKYGLSTDGSSWVQTVPFLYGAGGGASLVFSQPSYQAGTTPAGSRGVPDVAMDADPTTGMLVGQTQTFPTGVAYDEYRIGGTSLASPLFAGMTALAFQNAGGGVGLLNPVIYAHQGAFTDVTGAGPDAGNVRSDFVNGVDAAGGIKYSVRTFNQDSSLTTHAGWDDVTGLGSANPGWLTAVP